MTIPKADSISKVDVLSTGLPQLDRCLGIGGLPFKRIVEISGPWSSGKSTLAQQIVSEAQKKGYECIWFDSEWTWENQYSKSLGVDTSKLGLIQAHVAEDGLDLLLENMSKNKNTVMVIDAIGALHPREEAEKDSGSRTIGAQASLVARFCRKGVPLLSLNNHMLIVLNHEYMEIGATRPSVKTSGGAKLALHKSIWIRLMRAGTNIKVGDRFTGFDVKVQIKKNKLAPTEKAECNLEMRYGEGFSKTSDLLNVALEKGIITREGNTFFAFGEKLGMKTKMNELISNPSFAEKIQAAL